MAQEINEIGQIDDALNRYYIILGKGDQYKAEEEATGLFADYCQEYGIDLNDEFGVEAKISLLPDFDPHFPFPKGQQAEQAEAKKEWVFKLLKQIRSDPNMKFDHFVGQ